MTVLFKYATPRYTLQAAPALSIFAALPILAIPWTLPRRLAMGALAALLLFQYGDLTFHAYGPIARAQVPVSFRPVIYKDALTLGFSYSRLSPPVKENYKDRLFLAMIKEEQAQPYVTGEYANFLKLNVRGMAFDEVHFWPQPNPFQRKDLTSAQIPKRKFRTIGLGKTPEELLPQLANADYIVYAVDGADPAVRDAWQAFFKERDFRVVDQFFEAGFGHVPPRFFGVLARKVHGEVLEVKSQSDLDKLDIYELYNVQQSYQFQNLPKAIQDYVGKRISDLISERFPKPFPLNANLSFVSADVRKAEDGWYQFRFIFHVDQPLGRNWRIYFHGRVDPDNLQYLSEVDRPQGHATWNFSPDPPTMDWPVGQYVIVTHRIEAAPIPYSLIIGFFDAQSGEYYGRAVPIGAVDFSTVK
jgi:hypothetical protein